MTEDRTALRAAIARGETCLGIELGSTRIKAVLAGADHRPIAAGSHAWENRFENGYWTYSEEDIRRGLQACCRSLKEAVRRDYGLGLETCGAIGISAMMHGYLALGADGRLLSPFRTWRNTSTGPAAGALGELFGCNIPQRWSVAHLYQAILNGEAHVPDIRHLTTLAGHIHHLLTGERVLGAGDASGMFPLDAACGFDARMAAAFDRLL
ncbi:MAG: FGGY family carbohydrate kinase, partial [Clostridia bacterium]|nr:FGGY family carbohydrate kinase [Clostridia bacterium]